MSYNLKNTKFNDNKIIEYCYYILITTACAIHLIIGANIIAVLSTYIIAILSVKIMLKHSFYNLAAILIFLVGFRHTGFPLFIKLGFGEALDKNLWNPVESFGIVLIGFIGYLIAFHISMKLNFGKPYLVPIISHPELRRISIFSSIIGIIANIDVTVRGNEHSDSTIPDFFISFLHLGLIASIARNIRFSKGYNIDGLVFIIFISELFFSMARNSRITFIEIFLCFLVTIIAFGARINWQRFVTASLAITILIIILTPIFLYVRINHSNINLTQNVKETVKTAFNWNEALDYFIEWSYMSDRIGWYKSYYPNYENIFQRVSHVNNVDIMKSGTEAYGYIGIEDIYLAAQRALPRFVSPDKPVGHSQGSWLLKNLGIEDPGPYPNAPLIGTGYAAFGWLGAFFYPLTLGLIWLVMIKKLYGWNLHSNIWTIYLLLRIHNEFVEGSSDAYIVSILRVMPQDFCILLLTSIIAKGKSLRFQILKIQ